MKRQITYYYVAELGNDGFPVELDHREALSDEQEARSRFRVLVQQQSARMGVVRLTTAILEDSGGNRL